MKENNNKNILDLEKPLVNHSARVDSCSKLNRFAGESHKTKTEEEFIRSDVQVSVCV